MWIYLICIIEPLTSECSMEVDVPGVKRVGRTIIATGGVSTPGLERLSNGDLLASFRRLTPGLTGAGFSSWRGEVLRSRDGGLTWSAPILQINGKRPEDPDTMVPYYGMAQLDDGTILLPAMGPTRGTYMLRSTDNGVTWDGPDPAGQDIEGVDWSVLAPYGKIRKLSDGTVIFPVCGQFRGENVHVSGHLRSYDGGNTWTDFSALARGHVFYNDAIELPDGRMIAIIVNELSPSAHGMAPFYWTESHDLGKTWSEPDFTTGAIYGNSPALFLTKNGTLLCGYRWTGDIDQGYVGVGISIFNDDGVGGGSWDSKPTMVWLGRGVMSTYPGRSFSGYPAFSYADEERILCAYFMSWMGSGDSVTQDIEGVYFIEED